MKHYYFTRFFIALIILLSSWSYSDAQVNRFRVVEVNDGDTITIRVKGFLGIPSGNERVRLIGIDAPEFKQEPWGRLSKRHLKKLISESDWIVGVEFDVEKRDKYGRLLCYLWDKRGRLINERMLEDGYALLYTIPPNVKYSDRFIAAERRAQQRKAGIWGKVGLKKSPRVWREENPRY